MSFTNIDTQNALAHDDLSGGQIQNILYWMGKVGIIGSDDNTTLVPIAGIAKATVSVTPGAVSAGTGLAVTVTIDDVLAGDTVLVNAPTAGLGDVHLNIGAAYVSATDTVTIVFTNVDDTNPHTPSAGNYTFVIIR